jgi:hypothetical protein
MDLGEGMAGDRHDGTHEPSRAWTTVPDAATGSTSGESARYRDAISVTDHPHIAGYAAAVAMCRRVSL